MRTEHRLKLRGKRRQLIDELDPSDHTWLDNMIGNGVISDDQREKIRAQQTRRERAEDFLAILPYCGEKAYDSFIAALRYHDISWVAGMLESYDPTRAPADDVDDSQALVPFDPQQRNIDAFARSMAEFLAGRFHVNK